MDTNTPMRDANRDTDDENKRRASKKERKSKKKKGEVQPSNHYLDTDEQMTEETETAHQKAAAMERAAKDGRPPSLRQLIDFWSESDTAAELVQQFNDRVSLNAFYKRVEEARELLNKCELSFASLLDDILLPNYYLFDTKIGRSEKVLEYDHRDMMNYLCVKKEYLQLMYVCFKFASP